MRSPSLPPPNESGLPLAEPDAQSEESGALPKESDALPEPDSGRAIVYVDGFNLYYSIRYTPYRWLNLVTLSRLLFPSLQVQKVKYFTALVKPHRDDPGARTRQEAYLRALRTLGSDLEIHEGHFLRKQTSAMALAWGKKDNRWRRLLLAAALGDRRVLERGPVKVKVSKADEKGSDVNLASHLIADAYEEKFDVAAVLSNDGDLEYPLRFVREQLGKPVILFNAARFRHERLAPRDVPGSSYKRIREGLLSASQFPSPMSDPEGEFHRPQGWENPKKS